MPNDTEGQKAIDELNDTDFEGKTITVNIARPRADRSDYNRGGGGGNGGGYNKRRY